MSQIPEPQEERVWEKPLGEFFTMVALLLLVMGVVVYLCTTKKVVISQGASYEATSYQALDLQSGSTEWKILDVQDQSAAGTLSFTLPAAMRAENIVVENHYQDYGLLIRLKGTDSKYRANFALSGNVSGLVVAACRESSGEFLISFQMNGVWDYDISQENGKLIIKPFKASREYDHVVVIDPVFYSNINSNMDVTALIAEKIADAIADDMSGSESIRVYISRNEGAGIDDEEILDFLDACGADMYIRLALDVSTEATAYGMSAEYNDYFFNPSITNAVVAENLLKHTAVAAKNRANSLDKVGEGDFLLTVGIPSAQINLGYVSNDEESLLLSNDEYQNMIASGIVEAIKELAEMY